MSTQSSSRQFSLSRVRPGPEGLESLFRSSPPPPAVPSQARGAKTEEAGELAKARASAMEEADVVVLQLAKSLDSSILPTPAFACGWERLCGTWKAPSSTCPCWEQLAALWAKVLVCPHPVARGMGLGLIQTMADAVCLRLGVPGVVLQRDEEQLLVLRPVEEVLPRPTQPATPTDRPLREEEEARLPPRALSARASTDGEREGTGTADPPPFPDDLGRPVPPSPSTNAFERVEFQRVIREEQRRQRTLGMLSRGDASIRAQLTEATDAKAKWVALGDWARARGDMVVAAQALREVNRADAAIRALAYQGMLHTAPNSASALAGGDIDDVAENLLADLTKVAKFMKLTEGDDDDDDDLGGGGGGGGGRRKRRQQRRRDPPPEDKRGPDKGKGPRKCFVCGGPHMAKVCPNRYGQGKDGFGDMSGTPGAAAGSAGGPPGVS